MRRTVFLSRHNDNQSCRGRNDCAHLLLLVNQIAVKYSKECVMKRFDELKGGNRSDKRTMRHGRSTPADPGEFGKTTSPVRERMAREIKETPPEERIKRGP